METFGLSARAYRLDPRVARTVTDPYDAEAVERAHVEEAIQFCGLDCPFGR